MRPCVSLFYLQLTLLPGASQLVAVNSPDKIIFVGEALVGNEAVDQLSKFDRALRDFTSSASTGSSGTKGKARGIDGMILTKFDTIVGCPPYLACRHLALILCDCDNRTIKSVLRFP